MIYVLDCNMKVGRVWFTEVDSNNSVSMGWISVVGVAMMSGCLE